jgi:hypothetical protein
MNCSFATFLFNVDGGEDLVNGFLFERRFAKKVRTACSRTSYKIVPIITLNKYLYIGKSEIKVENSKKHYDYR